MYKIEREIEAQRIFYDHMQNNIFYTRCLYKLDYEIKISKTFPIYLKNLNDFEKEYVKGKIYKKLFSIVSIFPSLNYLLDCNRLNIDDKYIAFLDDVYYIQEMYSNYINNNDKFSINQAIQKNDRKSFCAYLSFYNMENIIIIDIKDWKKIDNCIVRYYNCKKDDIEDMDYRIHFIKQYINLFNIINFDLRKFQGINILNNIFELTNIGFYQPADYKIELEKVFKNIFIVDTFVINNSDIQNLFFIINVFENNRYMKERKYIVDFITCIEFFLIKKLNDNNSKIESQFNLKVRRCCKEFNYKVPVNELSELYNYRSLIVHGNFFDINRKINEITNKKWYVEYSTKIDSEFDEYCYDNNDKENLIYCRLYEIFNCIYRLYCRNKNDIECLKKITDKSKIDNFYFN